MSHSPTVGTEQGMIEALDPTGDVATSEMQTGSARRLDADRQVVGFLDNGKFNVAPLFANVEELLSQTRSLKAGVRVKKPITSKPTPAELLSELARHCDLVINGVGD